MRKASADCSATARSERTCPARVAAERAYVSAAPISGASQCPLVSPSTPRGAGLRVRGVWRSRRSSSVRPHTEMSAEFCADVGDTGIAGLGHAVPPIRTSGSPLLLDRHRDVIRLFARRTRRANARCCRGPIPSSTLRDEAPLTAPPLRTTVTAPSLLIAPKFLEYQPLLAHSGRPLCDVLICHIEYASAGGANDATTASRARMMPSRLTAARTAWRAVRGRRDPPRRTIGHASSGRVLQRTDSRMFGR